MAQLSQKKECFGYVDDAFAHLYRRHYLGGGKRAIIHLPSRIKSPMQRA